MGIQNLALVRAMKKEEFLQLIDNEGVLYPLDESVIIRMVKSLTESKVGKAIEKLKEDISIPYKDFPYSFEEYKEKYGEEYEKLNRYSLTLMGYNILVQMDKSNQKLQYFSDWIPLRFEYNSVILFSINGLVPDDIEGGAFANNTFSTDKFAVIIGLSDIIEKNDFASIVPTDTAVKRKIELPKGSYIVIDEIEYEKLSYERKESIERIREKGIKCISFGETLKQAISEVLGRDDRYTNERLLLSKQSQGYMESETKKEVLEAIREVADKYKIPEIYHFEYALEETEYYEYIYSYIENEFFRYLQKKGEPQFNYDKLISYDAIPYYDEFAKKIREYGIEKFHSLVKGFNSSILELKKLGKIPTPKELIKAKEKGNPISIIEDIMELEQNRRQE